VRLAQGEEQRIVLPRSAILVAPGASRCISAGGGADLAQAAFCRSVLNPELLGGAADGILSMFGSARGAATFVPSIIVTRMPPGAFDEASALFARLEAESNQRRAGRESMLRLVLAELLMIVYRCRTSGEEVRNTGPAHFRIEEAAAYIRDRYAEEISLPQLAFSFGFNPSYFSRLFARQTGIHVFEYLNRIRIQKSCLFLKRSSMSIVEIAFSVGYNNLSHFNRYFRRIIGMSPREYRNKSKK
jgi:AraC-like DNA-binding protein